MCTIPTANARQLTTTVKENSAARADGYNLRNGSLARFSEIAEAKFAKSQANHELTLMDAQRALADQQSFAGETPAATDQSAKKVLRRLRKFAVYSRCFAT
jgi:hypothetical protein